MSKIFEALKKTEGEMAELTLPVLTSDIPDADPVQASSVPLQTESKPSLVENVQLADEEQEEFADVDTQAAAAIDVRTLPVRIRADTPILPFQPGHSREGEQYRIARTKIIHHPDQPRLVVVSSAGSGDGKTVSAINLAGALALKVDAHVMLVDADLRRSSIARLLGLPDQPGLAEYLGGQCNIEDIIIRIEQFPNLRVVPAGRASANPTELLDSARWAEACGEFRRLSRFVIFDAPPMDTVADYDLIAEKCDGVVIVVREDCSDRKACLKGLATIPRGKLIGVLMNCVNDWFLWKTKGYYPDSAAPTDR
jgi:capsular exopolysaccharide synthesis family protein